MRDRVFIVRVSATREGVDSQHSTCVTEHEPDVSAIIAYGVKLGLDTEVDVAPATLLAGEGLVEIGAWLDSAADRDPKPTVERDRSAIVADELRREIAMAERRTERRFEQLTEMLLKLAYAAPSAPSRSSRMDGEIVKMPRHDGRALAPEHGAGDVRSALAENMQAGANGVVPGNMGLRGAPVNSTMLAPTVNAAGEVVLAELPLPKVGDTLKPIGG